MKNPGTVSYVDVHPLSYSDKSIDHFPYSKFERFYHYYNLPVDLELDAKPHAILSLYVLRVIKHRESNSRRTSLPILNTHNLPDKVATSSIVDMSFQDNAHISPKAKQSVLEKVEDVGCIPYRLMAELDSYFS